MDTRSTQSADLAAASTTEFHASRVGHTAHQAANVTSFVSKQHLCESITALAKAPEDNLQPLDFHQKTSLLDLRENVGRQLVGGIETGTATFAESNLTSTHGQDRVAVWPCQCENGIVLV